LLILGTPQAHDMAAPFTLSQPVRLAITPAMDGKVEEEEWDALADSGGCRAFFQWEPETLYWGARAKEGEDVVLSLDMNSDGWLVGNDNLEFRVSYAGGAPSVSVRRLDASDPNGPTWVASGVLNESVKVAAGAGTGTWDLEASFVPPSAKAPATGSRYGIRIDAVPAGAPTGEAFQPRALGFVKLQMDLGQDLPSGFSWKPDFLVRSVPVDDAFKVKYHFKKTEDVAFNQVECRAEGLAQGMMATGSRPFPVWDKKGAAKDEYVSSIATKAGVGYRVLRMTLGDGSEKKTVLRSSFRIADLIDFDVRLPKSLNLDPDARIVRGSVDLRSNGLRRVDGAFNIKVPEAWTVTRGKGTNFVIYHARGMAKVPIEIIVPRDQVGVFPLTFTAKVGDKTIEKTTFLSVGQP